MKDNMKTATKKMLALLLTALACSMLCGMMAMAAAQTLKPTILRTGFKKSSTKVAKYNLTVPASKEEMVVPVKITESGRVYLKLTAKGAADVSVGLYKERDCSDYSVVSWYVDTDNGTTSNENKYGIWLNKGTYYLKFYKYSIEAADSYTTEYDAKLQMQMYEYSGKGATLQSGKWLMLSYENEYSAQGEKQLGGYYKIVVPKKGYIRVESSKDSEKGGSFTFFNSKKKKFENVYGWFGDDAQGKSDHTYYIAVQKGTYYIQMSGSGNKKIRYTFKADPSKTNYTKNKAISLKRGKLVENVFYSNAKKSTLQRWYKINITKAQRIVWEGQGDLRDAKGYYVSTVYDNGRRYSREKVKKGTYYFVVDQYEWDFINKKRTMGEYKFLKWVK